MTVLKSVNDGLVLTAAHGSSSLYEQPVAVIHMVQIFPLRLQTVSFGQMLKSASIAPPKLDSLHGGDLSISARALSQHFSNSD